MKNSLVILLVLISLFAMNCTTSRKIQQTMNYTSRSLTFILDSNINIAKSGINITIDSVNFNSKIIESQTKVESAGGWYLPLIFFHAWNLKKECNLGISNFKEDISEFLKSSLISEIKNSSPLIYTNSDSSEYKLNISIDSLSSTGPYKNKGFYFFIFVAYGNSYNDIAGPALSKLTITYTLTKNTEIIKQKTVNSETLTQIISNKDFGNIKILQQEYIKNMVSATSLNFNKIVQEIIAEISITVDQSFEQ